MPLPFQARHELTQVKRGRDVKLPDESGMPSLSACADALLTSTRSVELATRG